MVKYLVRLRDWLLTDKVSQVIMWSVVGFTIAVMGYIIMLNTNWNLGDDALMMGTTAIGKPYYSFNTISYGRFFILGYVDYNLLTLFPKAAWGIASHYFMNIIVFGLMIWTFILIFNPKTAKERYIAAIFVATLASIIPALDVVFTEVIFPERLLTLYLALFLLCYFRAKERDSGLFYGLAMFFGVVSLYTKEPMSAALMVIALIDVLFAKPTRNSKRFDLGLVINAIVFVCLWYFVAYRPSTHLYIDPFAAHPFNNLLHVIKIIPIIPVLFTIGFIRVWFVLVKHDRGNLAYDATLFAGISYAMAIIIMGLNSLAYFIPAIIFAIPCLYHWVSKIKFRTKGGIVFAAVIIVLFVKLEHRPRVTLRTNAQKQAMEFAHKISAYSNIGKPVLWYREDSDDWEKIMGDWANGSMNAMYNFIDSDKWLKRIDPAPHQGMKAVSYKDKVNINAVYLYPRRKGQPRLAARNPVFHGFVKIGECYFWNDWNIDMYIKK